MAQRARREFLEPMLLVTLFSPGAELSAAAALATLYYFALARQARLAYRIDSHSRSLCHACQIIVLAAPAHYLALQTAHPSLALTPNGQHL